MARWRSCRNCKQKRSGGDHPHRRHNKDVLRHRASPARIMNLCPYLTAGQRKLIEDAGFGGLLKIRSPVVPARLCTWLLRRFDAESCELVISGRGRIPVTAHSVHRVLGIPNRGRDVEYDFDAESTGFVLGKIGVATAPSVGSLEKSIKNMKLADEHFLRTFMMIVLSTFLCPNTSLTISPRCFPSLVEIGSIRELNWCKFVVEQLRMCISSYGRKNSVGGCLFYLVILYLESLDVRSVEIPDGTPRISVWDRKLIDKVIHMDTKNYGSFGKCFLKSKKVAAGDITSRGAPSSSVLFGDVSAIANFVSSNVLPGYSPQNKEALCKATSNLCSSITNALSKFMREVSGLEGCSRKAGKGSTGAAQGEDNNVENSGDCTGEAGKDISGVDLIEDESVENNGDQMDVDTLPEDSSELSSKDMEDTSEEEYDDETSADSEAGDSSSTDSEHDHDWKDDSNRIAKNSHNSEVPRGGTIKSREGTSQGSGHDLDVLEGDQSRGIRCTEEQVNLTKVTSNNFHVEVAVPTPSASRASTKQQKSSEGRFAVEDKSFLKRVLHPVTPPGFEARSGACAVHALTTRSRSGSPIVDKMTIESAGPLRGDPSSLKSGSPIEDKMSPSKGDMNRDKASIVDLSTPTSSDSECTIIRTVSNPPYVNGPKSPHG